MVIIQVIPHDILNPFPERYAVLLSRMRGSKRQNKRRGAGTFSPTIKNLHNVGFDFIRPQNVV